MKLGRDANHRLVVLDSEELTPHSGEQRSTHEELTAPKARALVELDREWREAFGVPISESITEGTVELTERDLLADSEPEKTPPTMPAPYGPIPPAIPEH